MPQPYSPKTFFRQVPKVVLREFFDRFSPLDGFAWESVSERSIDPLFEAFQILPPETQRDLERAFQEIHAMATDDGIRAIIEESDWKGLALGEVFAQLDGVHHCAMRAYLDHK